MTEQSPKAADEKPAATTRKSGDAGQAEVQAKSDEDSAKGYHGVRPDGPDNEAWSLQSGPDSPSVHELKNGGRK
jgi:hypothetical protein